MQDLTVIIVGLAFIVIFFMKRFLLEYDMHEHEL